jgi:hypothetical protein
MIELNCSYEESKKILELGYDFRKIATDFVIDFATKFNQTKLKRVNAVMAIDSSIDTFAISGFPQNKPDYFYFIKSNHIIPIIPKAALEACLPVTLHFGTYNRGYLIYDYLHSKFHYYERMDAFYGHEKAHKSFNSACEAFIWCHKNYPEELKKKFEEVMG